MLQEQFEVLGFFEDTIFFELQEKIIAINKKLPKEDMILKLKVEPEDVKPLRDEILVEASQRPLTYDQKTELTKHLS